MPEPYYEKAGGLAFECTRCGACCTRPGPVYFPPRELERAAAFLGLTPSAFRRRYRVGNLDGVPALDPGAEAACPFHAGEAGCAIYEVRPTQCRTFPFWTEIVGRARSWANAGRECEGIGRGRRHAPREIARHVTACRDAGLPRSDPW